MTGLGAVGYTPAQVQSIIHTHLGLTAVWVSTIRSRVAVGYRRWRGKPTANNYHAAPLTAAELAAVERMIGPPAAPDGRRPPPPLGEPESVLPEEVVEPAGLFEGAVRTITVNSYERNPAARRACIAEYGTRCCVCDFDFVAVYGPVMEGYIQVHHLRPLSEVGRGYRVDLVADLRPVCPNCHAAIHHGGGCRDVRAVRRMLGRGDDA